MCVFCFFYKSFLHNRKMEILPPKGHLCDKNLSLGRILSASPKTGNQGNSECNI